VEWPELTLNNISGHGHEIWKEGAIVRSKIIGGGSHKVIEEIADTKMSQVWKVLHIESGVYFAVKNSKQPPTKNYTYAIENEDRFRVEAKVSLSLDIHPNIVTFFSLETLLGLPRMFIEYIEGGSLRDWIKSGKVRDWRTILTIAIQIANGMSYAHENGLIHRDLKPGNILMLEQQLSTTDAVIIESPIVKITDFGIVKIMIDSAENLNEIVSGSPGYRAPEQRSKKFGSIGKDTDVYSFGIILCELITGFLPDQMEDIDDIERYVTEFIRKDCKRVDCPASLVDLITKCLHINPKDQYHHFDTIKNDLIDIYKDVTREHYSSIEDRRHDNPQLLAMLYIKKAFFLSRMGEDSNAITKLNKAIELDPTNFLAYINKAECLRASRYANEAKEALDWLTEIIPDDSDLWFVMGAILNDLGDLNQALNAIERVIKLDPRHILAYINKGIILDKMGEHSEALGYFEKALEIDPNSRDALQFKGLGLLQLGKYNDAKIYFDKLLKEYQQPTFAERFDRDSFAGFYNNMGRTLYHLGQYVDALKAYEKALEIDPKFIEALNNKGICIADSQGNYPEAIRLFKIALEINPKEAGTYNNIGRALYLLREYTEAIWYIDQAIKLDPKHADAYTNKASCIADSEGNYPEAIRLFKKVLEINPKRAATYADIGIALLRSGKYPEAVEAIEYFKKALELDPNNPTAREILGKLKGDIQDNT
jgi:tetratricopeptide (TPR) repeat protein